MPAVLSAISPAVLLWSIYVCGVVVLLGRMALAERAAHRLVTRGEPVDDPRWRALLDRSARAIGCPRPVALIRSDDCAMPMAIGTWRPAIVVPSFADEWSEDRRQAVLRHELAHIARRDCLTQALASLATALYWPHPGSWWAAARLRAERELACDDRVLSAGSPARDYASHLLEIAHALGHRRVPALGVTMARPNQLEGRLLAVIDDTRNRRVLNVRQQALVIAIVGAVLVPVAALRAVPAKSPAGLMSLGNDAPAAPQQPSRSQERVQQPRMAGTWELRPASDTSTSTVHLNMTDGSWTSGHTIRFDALEGIAADKLSSSLSQTNVHFTLKRDAGTFTFDGVCAKGACGGTFAFAASPTFAGELAKRGIARPTELQQYEMARDDVRLALVDELKSQGYATPSIDELVRAGQHGVSYEYVRDFGALGYKVGQVAPLITMRDHGVTPEETRALASLGLAKLSAEDLVRARDHGATSDYVKGMQENGYRSLTVDQLVNARDHGVTPEYAKGIRGLGYNDLTVEQLITARDHGVDPNYIKGMTDAGYGKLALELYIRMRDHGVTADWARRATSNGHLDAEELIRRKDRGGN